MPIFAARLCCPKGHLIIMGAAEGDEALGSDRTYFHRLLFDELMDLDFNPYCGVCKAPQDSWHMDIERLKLSTFEEALAYLKEMQEKERLELALLRLLN